MLNLPSTQVMNTVVPTISVDVRDVIINSDWRQTLPVLAAEGVTLRELRVSDAPTLLAMLTTEEVARFITPPPTTVEGFEKFIAWTHREQAAGRYVCFGVVPAGRHDAVGIIQIRALDKEFGTAEWGFAIGSAFWGTGVFQAAAREVVGFAFKALPVRRLEARAVVKNGRGNGALNKLGASCEAVLRSSFRKGETNMDQMLWSILKSDWTFQHTKPAGLVH
jgi:[ribosomal protein S5]-alanine N-acetyltransferase